MAEPDRRVWTPTDERTHPPFEPGNTLAETHGAYSERRVAPLAAAVEEDARAAEGWPQWLNGPQYASAVASWAWAEATVRLLRSWLAEQDITTWLTDTSTEESTERHTKAKSTRVTTARRQGSALEMLRKWESILAGRRRDLGLDPLSRARLGKDLAITGAVGSRLHELSERGAALVAEARRAGALDTEDHEVAAIADTDDHDEESGDDEHG